MNRSRFAAQTLIAGIAASAMCLLAATPASAHTNNIFSYLEDEMGATPGFVTLDRATAAMTPLPVAATIPTSTMLGIEVAGEVATAFGIAFTETSIELRIFNWDHSTGEEGDWVDASVAESVLFNGSGLDITSNGTMVTFVEYNERTVVEGAPVYTEKAAIGTVNVATGVITPVIQLEDYLDDNDYSLESFATDPISGVTYAFLNVENGPVLYGVVDLASATLGPLSEFEGVGFDGGIAGADFDADGTLHFIFYNPVIDGYELSTVGAPSTWPTAERNAIGPVSTGELLLSPLALAVESAPALADTGAEFPALALALGGVAVIAGAVTVVATTRRRNGAVV